MKEVWRKVEMRGDLAKPKCQTESHPISSSVEQNDLSIIRQYINTYTGRISPYQVS